MGVGIEIPSPRQPCEFQSKKVGEWGTRPPCRKTWGTPSRRPRPRPTTPLAVRWLHHRRSVTLWLVSLERCAQPARRLDVVVSADLVSRPAVHDSLVPFTRRTVIRPATLDRRWLGSRVVSVLDSGAEGPGFKSQPRRCRVTVLGKLFAPIVPLFTKQRNW